VARIAVAERCRDVSFGGMKFLTSQLAYFVRGPGTRRNLKVLFKFFLVLVGLVTLYTILFHLIMDYEGQSHSWLSGLYWTMVTMSTLGFGDIVFHSDLGRVFSVFVIVSGVLFLLIVLPFTFIQFFYAPWLEAQTRLRVPRSVDPETRDHVIMATYEPVAMALVERLKLRGRPYFIIEPDLRQAIDLEDQGYTMILGERDDPETYRRIVADRAALVIANDNDFVNTNVAFTVREMDEHVPVVVFARDPASVDVLQLAGASHVIELAEMLGQSLARRTLGGDHRANIVGEFDELVVAEAPVTGTPMVGKTLGEGWLRRTTGLTVVGAWERGTFAVPGPETEIHDSTVLVLAGSRDQLELFEELTAIYTVSEAPVLVIGGGRVGRAAAEGLRERGIEYRIIERDPARVHDPEHTVVGNAADLECLRAAGIADAPAAIITTADDATNIFLTNYCRRLRPDLAIVSRATLERNVSTLHRAGADFVMSYASMGANMIINLLERGDVVMVAEGLDVFRTPVPEALTGRLLRYSQIRERTGCHLVAWRTGNGMVINPAPDAPIPESPDSELILVGTTDAEREFHRLYTRR
jgi:voltage-gated potassium channel